MLESKIKKDLMTKYKKNTKKKATKLYNLET